MKYLYYKQYQFHKWVGTESQPGIPSFMFISLIQSIYLNHLLFLINYFVVPFFFGIIGNICLLFALMIFNYFKLYKRSGNILSLYKGESKSKSIIGFTFLFLFIASSLVLIPLLTQFYGPWK